jgi:hypothetical protein
MCNIGGPSADGEAAAIGPATVPSCRAGLPAQVFPSSDALVCDGDGRIQSNHLLVLVAGHPRLVGRDLVHRRAGPGRQPASPGSTRNLQERRRRRAGSQLRAERRGRRHERGRRDGRLLDHRRARPRGRGGLLRARVQHPLHRDRTRREEQGPVQAERRAHRGVRVRRRERRAGGARRGGPRSPLHARPRPPQPRALQRREGGGHVRPELPVGARRVRRPPGSRRPALTRSPTRSA